LKMIKLISPPRLMKLLSFWPPYFFAGITVKEVNEDFTRITVQMKQRPWNTNYVGSHFGGSLYSMCDPFFMFILLHHLKGHIIWDKAASFKFKKPGVGIMSAVFEISNDSIEQVKKDAAQNYSISPIFKTVVTDQLGETVLELEKTLYVKKKA